MTRLSGAFGPLGAGSDRATPPQPTTTSVAKAANAAAGRNLMSPSSSDSATGPRASLRRGQRPRMTIWDCIICGPARAPAQMTREGGRKVLAGYRTAAVSCSADFRRGAPREPASRGSATPSRSPTPQFRSLRVMRIGILTGGGDAPGLNAAIRAAARRSFQLGHKVSGIKNGWAGALAGDISDLTPADVRGILPLGGTILGTSRTNPMKEQDGIARVRGTLRRFGVDGLVAIGGDDTLSVARALHEAGYRVVGVPETLEHDLPATHLRSRFHTAVGSV